LQLKWSENILIFFSFQLHFSQFLFAIPFHDSIFCKAFKKKNPAAPLPNGGNEFNRFFSGIDTGSDPRVKCK